MNQTLLGALFLSLAASIWGAMYVVVKVVVEVIPPFELVWMRYFIAALTLLGIAFVTKQSFYFAKKDWALLFIIALIGNTISIVTQEMGTMYSNAQMGAIITATTPAFMVVFARFILKERITWKKCLSIGLATAGVFIIVGLSASTQNFQLGGLYLIIAALTWALMSVLIKRVPNHYSQLIFTMYTSIIAVVLLSPIVLPRLPTLDWHAVMEPSIYGGVLYLGIISTAGGFFLWNKGLQLMNASSGGLFFFFQPIVGALLGWLLLGETIGPSFFIGTLCIFVGVFLVIKE